DLPRARRASPRRHRRARARRRRARRAHRARRRRGGRACQRRRGAEPRRARSHAQPRARALTHRIAAPRHPEAVDRTKPDTGYNRSARQRVPHPLNDASGVRLCNKQGAVVTFFGFPTTLPYDECDLLEVDDLAIFYMQSIAYAKDANGNVMEDDKGRPLPKAVL